MDRAARGLRRQSRGKHPRNGFGGANASGSATTDFTRVLIRHGLAQMSGHENGISPYNLYGT